MLPKEKLLRMFQMVGDICNAGCLLIDLRRTDYEGGTIKGSLNIPAQSFYYNMAVLYRLCRGDGVNVMSRVLFYCGMSLNAAIHLWKCFTITPRQVIKRLTFTILRLILWPRSSLRRLVQAIRRPARCRRRSRAQPRSIRSRRRHQRMGSWW